MNCSNKDFCSLPGKASFGQRGYLQIVDLHTGEPVAGRGRKDKFETVPGECRANAV